MSGRARAQQLQNQRAQLAAQMVRAVGNELMHLQRQQAELDRMIQQAYAQDSYQQQQFQSFQPQGGFSGGGGW